MAFTKRALAFSLLCACSAVVVLAHPGHEYHVEGTISKIRAPHFAVEDAKGNVTDFTLVPGTEVFLNKSRAAVSDIAAGARAEVDGVENERGLVEARKVSLTR